MVYIADMSNSSMIVYDYANNVSWRIVNSLFGYIPGDENFTIVGESFVLKTGLLGMALGNVQQATANGQTDRFFYFHSLGAKTENRVPLSVVNNRAAFLSNSSALSDQFVKIGDR